jgi:hypothetical protein
MKELRISGLIVSGEASKWWFGPQSMGYMTETS